MTATTIDGMEDQSFPASVIATIQTAVTNGGDVNSEIILWEVASGAIDLSEAGSNSPYHRFRPRSVTVQIDAGATAVKLFRRTKSPGDTVWREAVLVDSSGSQTYAGLSTTANQNNEVPLNVLGPNERLVATLTAGTPASCKLSVRFSEQRIATVQP